MNEKIDIVIVWVDGSDREWMDKKTFWQEEYGIINNTEERYRNWDNLQCLFRGIEKYATWVNHVFLVTDKQSPEWLDENYKKITLVDHTEIIEDRYLPTFNSQAIELNLHKINQLSENFIYFNDDMFIIDETFKTDFFENGIPMDSGILNINVPIKNQPIYQFNFNNLSLINHEFSKSQAIKEKPFNWFTFKYGKQLIKNIILLPWNQFTGFNEPHLCAPYNKETFNIVWKKYDEELLKTTKSKFRENHNYSQSVMRYWQLASNKFVPRKGSLGKNCSLSDLNSVYDCSNYIRDQKGKVVCVNDGENLSDFNNAKESINHEFQLLFPKKSKFEK